MLHVGEKVWSFLRWKFDRSVINVFVLPCLQRFFRRALGSRVSTEATEMAEVVNCRYWVFLCCECSNMSERDGLFVAKDQDMGAVRYCLMGF